MDVGIQHELGRESVLLEAQTQDLVLRIAPGEVTVGCGDPTLPNLPPSSAFRIEDPDGMYRSMDIGAGAGGCVSASLDYAEGARGMVDRPGPAGPSGAAGHPGGGRCGARPATRSTGDGCASSGPAT